MLMRMLKSEIRMQSRVTVCHNNKFIYAQKKPYFYQKFIRLLSKIALLEKIDDFRTNGISEEVYSERLHQLIFAILITTKITEQEKN